MAITNTGIDPVIVWDYTPYEVFLLSEQKAHESKDKVRLAVLNAYYTEAFARYKRLPKLNKVLDSIESSGKKELSKGDMILKAMAREKGIII